MFIYSLRASSLKFFAVVLAGVAVLVALILVFPAEDTASVAVDGEIRYEKIKTGDDRINFLFSLGYTVDPEPIEEKKVMIPTEFDKTMVSYNELQKVTGLDLYKYRGKEVTQYSYNVTNYPGYDGKVYANLLIAGNRVIGGDICSADVSGFIHGLRQVEP